MLVGVLALQIAFGVGLVTAAFWRMFRTRLFATHWPGRVARFFAGFSLLFVFLFIEAGFQIADTPPDQKGILWAAYTIAALVLGALISVEIEVNSAAQQPKRLKWTLLVWNLDECETGSQLLDQFERFVHYWVSPIIGRAIEPAIRFDLDLPPSLIRMLKLNASYSERLFECQHRLLPPSEIRRENDRLYFVDVDCFGHEFAYIHLQGNEDPFVYLEGYDDPVDRLSSYLVSFGLQELMYWAALNDNDAGECWEIPIPELCTAHKIPHVVMRQNTNCIHPAHEVTIHLCNHQVLSVESPSSSVRYLSSGTIDAKLKKVIRTRYPGW